MKEKKKQYLQESTVHVSKTAKKKLLHDGFSVEELRQLSSDELTQLSQEIRQCIIDKCLKTGGHLSPSLGVVELTLALHYTFQTPQDQIIWDVGHQAYAHKIITGRVSEFWTLRSRGGISGFLRRAESPFDVYGAGHASTSVAAAAGFAKARDLNNEEHKVIAVIGDGAMTGGLAFEGLNLIGSEKLNVMVILNDNDMSIDKNVGGLSKYFNRAISARFYNRIREDMQKFVKSLPAGASIYEWLRRLEESMKNMMIKGAFYEDLGFNYIGPVDGHNIRELISLLKKAREIKGPVLLHVRTKKGKGYLPAEEDAEAYHGISGRNSKKKKQTYTNIVKRELKDLGEKDPDIIAITAAMPSGTGLCAFKESFPERYIDVGIAEEGAVTMATALALSGKKPFVAIYSTFLQRAYDQLIHDTALQKAPVRFLLDRAGLVGEDGPTHHGAFDIAYLRSVPGMTLLAPADRDELKAMIRFCYDFQKGPVALRYPRGESIPRLDKKKVPVEYGRGVLLREGKDILILALGRMVAEGLKAAEELEQSGLSAGVFNLRFAKPLDESAILALSSRYRAVVALEYGTISGGIGEALGGLLLSKGKYAQGFLSIGLPDAFVEHGAQDELMTLYGLNGEALARKIEEWFRSE